MFLSPLLSALMSFLLLHEVPGMGTFVGGAIIICGLLLFNWTEKGITEKRMKKEKDKSSFLLKILFNLLYSVVGLVCSAPVNHVLRRLAAAYADIRDFFLFKRNTSAGCRCSFLDGILTMIAAPHCFNEAGCLDC